MPSITEIVNGVIYLLTSPSGKQYVGQTWEFEKRMSDYRRGDCKDQPALYSAIRKYGWENFTCVIIAQGIQTQDALDATEDAFIMLLNTLSPHGYNLRRGGGGGKMSEESRAKMSASSRGQVPWNKGKSVSDETRAKMSAANSGEKHPLFGKSPSAETRKKISAANRGKKRSPEAVAKTAAANRGKKRSDETRKKMSASHCGKSPSVETRAKIAATLRARNQQNSNTQSFL